MIRKKAGIIIVISFLFVFSFLVFGILKCREIKSAVEISNKYFPDPILRETIEKQFDIDKNGVLSLQEIRRAKELVIIDKKSRMKAVKLDGLQYLFNLTKIKIHAHLIDAGHSLREIKQLEELEIDGNLVDRKLDISQNDKLQVLISKNNFIDELELKNAKKIRKMEVTVSGEQAIRLSDLDDLEQLSIHAYGVPEIEIRNCHNVKRAKIIGDRVRLPVNISIQNCYQLQNLYIEGSWIKNIDLNKLGRLVTLDIKDVTTLKSCQLRELPKLWNLCIESALALEELVFYHVPELKIVKATEIKELPKLDFSDVPKLRELEIYGSGNNRLTHIDWGEKGKIEKLDVLGFSKLNCLSLTGMSNIKDLTIRGLSKAKISVEELPKLKRLNLEVTEENLDCLDLRGALQLEKMEISGGMRKIYLDKNELLKEVTLLGLRKLEKINFKNTPNIQKIEFEDVSKLEVDLSSLTKLKAICVSGNKSTDYLDLQEIQDLETFEWISGNLKEIKWGEKPNLRSVIINNNYIEGTLCLDNFESLINVDCENNRLSKIYARNIDFAGETGLMLNCRNNNLREINLKNTFVGELFCEVNPNVKIYLSKDITDFDKNELRVDRSAKIIKMRNRER